MSDVERLMSRRQIARLINADKVEIVISRRPRVTAPGGGWRYGVGVNLPPQIVSIIPFKRRMSEIVINTESGDVLSGDYVILGEHDLDVARYDTFTLAGEHFRVIQVDLKVEVRKAALVEYYGGEDG